MASGRFLSPTLGASQLAIEGISDCCDTTIELEVVGANEIFRADRRQKSEGIGGGHKEKTTRISSRRGRKLVQRIAWRPSAWAVKALAME